MTASTASWDEGLGESLPSIHITKPHALKDRFDSDVEAIAEIIKVRAIPIGQIRFHIALPESDVNTRHCKAIARALVDKGEAVERNGVLWHPDKLQKMQERSPTTYVRSQVITWIDPSYRTWRSPSTHKTKSKGKSTSEDNGKTKPNS